MNIVKRFHLEEKRKERKKGEDEMKGHFDRWPSTNGMSPDLQIGIECRVCVRATPVKGLGELGIGCSTLSRL